ncbi:hypothetical protein GCM10027286_05980 [Virgibacillus ainsalahensis]
MNQIQRKQGKWGDFVKSGEKMKRQRLLPYIFCMTLGMSRLPRAGEFSKDILVAYKEFLVVYL